MEEQFSLFDVEELSVINGGKDKNDEPNDQIKCFRIELQEVEYKTPEELFMGFNTIKAITFSYDIGFIDSIMQQFDYGEIILGADFMVEKDDKLVDFLTEVYTDGYEAGQVIKPHKRLVDMLREGDIEFRTPANILDHRKIYLLKADDGKTRVITTSANMSRRAWNNGHMEFYNYDDSAYCYEEYLQDFETMWQDSLDIPYAMVSIKKDHDLIEGNPILKTVKETGRTIVLQQREDPFEFENVKYGIDHARIKAEYKALISGVDAKAKNGLIEIVPKTIETIEHNYKKFLCKTAKVNNISKPYPTLEFDYADKTASIDGNPLNLHPSEEEVKNDINELLGMYENYDIFVGNSQKLKETHFKMMNAIFCSPFNAKLRCTAKIRGINAATDSLPLFLLAASSEADSGKTFAVRTALKMMTGADLTIMNKANCKKEDIKAVQVGCKGVPFFVDELDNKFLAIIKDIIKFPSTCEENQLENQPMIIFASNDVVEPDTILRKRMVFLRFDGGLPSDIDLSATKGTGEGIIRRLGTGLYREYLRRMIDEVAEILEYMIHEKNIPDSYYPDLMAISSKTIISILEEYGYDIPEYFKTLTWRDDYSPNANCISEDSIEDIRNLYQQNRKAFTIEKDYVTIELGTDKGSQKRCENWKNTLPNELRPEYQKLRDCSKITLDRKELEKRLGFKLGSFPFFRR
jgi:hypothetical protein